MADPTQKDINLEQTASKLDDPQFHQNDDIKETQEVNRLIELGSKCFALKNFNESVEYFSQACEKLSEKFGEKHSRLIDVQIFYGKALLNNAIRLNSIISNTTKAGLNSQGEEADDLVKNGDSPLDDSKTQNGQGSSTHKNLEPSIQSGPVGRASKSNSGSAEPSSSKAPSKPPGHNPRIHFSGDSSDEDEPDQEGKSAVDGDGNNEEICSAEDELENAFQVLELARLTLLSQLSSHSDQTKPDQAKQDRVKLCTVYDLLAQVHQESEQFELAVESYTSSLEFKESSPPGIFPPRSLAESHLMIALALELVPGDSNSTAKSIEHVDRAIQLMKQYSLDLEKQKADVTHQNPDSSKDSASDQPQPYIDNTEASQISSEVEEVKSLIVELEAKKDELKTVAQPPELSEKDKILQQYLDSVINSNHKSIDKGVVNDLNQLVKKKRPRNTEGTDPANHDSEGHGSNSQPKDRVDSVSLKDDHNMKKAKLEQ